MCTPLHCRLLIGVVYMIGTAGLFLVGSSMVTPLIYQPESVVQNATSFRRGLSTPQVCVLLPMRT